MRMCTQTRHTWLRGSVFSAAVLIGGFVLAPVEVQEARPGGQMGATQSQMAS